ncbi:MAG: LysM peptidoglycan-binding domain-containing protein [Gammaproteobacteria bacterium]|nr:LysM peptidoglycan-binding domain-containing protein [Gammaproteobacteria bacterium]MDH5728604.1 LysM peptidoglycan-binding domain-containing protein [Gammaproteobacteria bacterium]
MFSFSKKIVLVLIFSLGFACSEKEKEQTIQKSPSAPMSKQTPEPKASTESIVSANKSVQSLALPNEIKYQPVLNKVKKRKVDRYVVQAGDSLWKIAAKKKIHNNPMYWPLIFKANTSQIKDPDLIKPGMILVIEQGYDEIDLQLAMNHAKTRGKWAVGSIEASDLAFLAQTG